MKQSTFIFGSPVGDAPTDFDRFREIHSIKPNIYFYFKKKTFELIERGFTHHSAYGVMHVVRFELARPDMRPEEDFKISNNLIPYYARLFLRDFPEYKEPESKIDFFDRHKITKEYFCEDWIDGV